MKKCRISTDADSSTAAKKLLSIFLSLPAAIAGKGHFLLTKKCSEKAKHPQICPIFGGNVRKT